MEILVGRQGNQPFAIKHPSVSKRHALVTFDDHTGSIIIKDLESVNGTYIQQPDGSFQRIKSAKVNKDTVVRLGVGDTFVIGDLVRKGVTPPQEYNISHLSRIYDTYNNNKVDIETKTGNIMMYRMLALSSSSIIMLLISVIAPDDIIGDTTTTNIIKLVVSVIVIVISWLLVSAMNGNLVRRKHANEKYFRKKYTCPRCTYFLGQKPYENLVAEGKCPNPSCKCKFVAKK